MSSKKNNDIVFSQEYRKRLLDYGDLDLVPPKYSPDLCVVCGVNKRVPYEYSKGYFKKIFCSRPCYLRYRSRVCAKHRRKKFPNQKPDKENPYNKNFLYYDLDFSSGICPFCNVRPLLLYSKRVVTCGDKECRKKAFLHFRKKAYRHFGRAYFRKRKK